MTGRVIRAALIVAAALGSANASLIYNVTFDTSGFDPSGNPYQMDVNLISQNGGDASSVTLDNFTCNGCPSTAQTLTAADFSQDLLIPFVAGGGVEFDLTLSPDLTYLESLGP